jgi:hypothetical protein
MFKLVPNPIFTVTVQITVPGEAKPQSLVLTCRHKPRDALKAWIDSAANAAQDAEFLAQVVEGWSGVVGEDGQPLACTPQTLAALLNNYPAAGREIFEAYIKELSESRAKN